MPPLVALPALCLILVALPALCPLWWPLPSRSSLVAPEGWHGTRMGHPWEVLFALAILSFISAATFQLFPFWLSSLGCGGRLQVDPTSRLIPAPG